MFLTTLHKPYSLGCEKLLYKLFTGRIISTHSRLIFDEESNFLVPFSGSGTKVPNCTKCWQIWANLDKFLKSSNIYRTRMKICIQAYFWMVKTIARSKLEFFKNIYQVPMTYFETVKYLCFNSLFYHNIHRSTQHT